MCELLLQFDGASVLRLFGLQPIQLKRVINDGVFKGGYKNRRVLPVLRYPRNMVIYHYPPIGVIYMVILHVFIIKNYPNFFPNDYP